MVNGYIFSNHGITPLHTDLVVSDQPIPHLLLVPFITFPLCIRNSGLFYPCPSVSIRGYILLPPTTISHLCLFRCTIFPLFRINDIASFIRVHLCLSVVTFFCHQLPSHICVSSGAPFSHYFASEILFLFFTVFIRGFLSIPPSEYKHVVFAEQICHRRIRHR